MAAASAALAQLRVFPGAPRLGGPANASQKTGNRYGGLESAVFLGQTPKRLTLRANWAAAGQPRGRLVVAAEATPEDSSGGVAVEDAEDNVGDDDVADEEGEQLSASPEEEEDREHIRNIMRVVELLRTKRDMTFNEVRLTIVIEDPREVERRRILNIEDDRGCSREDLGDALVEVYEGRVPQDRTVLRELANDMLNWPNLEDELDQQGLSSLVASPYAQATDTGVDPRIAAERAKVDWDKASDIEPGQEKKELSDVLPPAVGFSFLYLISALPVIIGITVVVILFLNSLQ